MPTIDLNCDMGESFGAYRIGKDEELLDYITSANIACGFHAGDPSTMRKTVQVAIEKNVAIGAHPGLPDLEGFGRRRMDVSYDEAYDMVLYQIGSLQAFVKASGSSLNHVKPHGALYNMAAKDKHLADAIAQAVHDVDSSLILFGLSGSELVKAGKERGLNTASEVFADRTYQQDGSLTPRSQHGALITDEKESIDQVIRMAEENKVRTLQGAEIDLEADTVCIHGDGPHAVDFAASLIKAFEEANILCKKLETSR